jgi:Zn-dependent peptidase ImmA (M78 family)
MIYGERIKQVRELNGWTQTDVAKHHGVTQPFIAQIENGWTNAPDEFVQAFAFRTGFTRQFFEIPPDADLPLGSLLFRSRADMTEREQKALRAHASMAHEVLQRMIVGRTLKEPPTRVPHAPGDPERAASIARSELGLSPEQPVKHVIYTMESAGILVIGLPRAFVSGDAFCVWAMTTMGGRRPIVVMSSDRPADRVRLSAAHELGHLVMHNPLPASPDVHDEANRFAGAFLLPADAFRQEITRATTLETFLSIKLKWGISVQAAIVRAHELELITQRKYRTLFQRLSAKGWRTHEPLSNRVPLERPRAFRQIAELIYGRRLDYTKIARDVRYPEAFLKELMEAHAGRDAAVAQPSKPESQPVVENRPGVLTFSKNRRTTEP